MSSAGPRYPTKHWTWRYFMPKYVDDTVVNATCTFCGYQYKGSQIGNMTRHLLKACARISNSMKETLTLETQSSRNISTSCDITRLFALANVDPSSINLSSFEGTRMPSPYEAGLISPQFRDFVIWYQEATKQKKLQDRYQMYMQKQWDHAYEDFNEVMGERYSRYLEEAVEQVDAGKKCQIGAEEFNALYEHIRAYRRDNSDAVFDTSYYCYFLIDSSKLPRSDRGFRDTTFRQFLDAVFYIGKGVEQRAMDHLKDAILYRLRMDPEERQRRFPDHDTERFDSVVKYLKNPRKLAHIVEIWSRGAGVIVFDGMLRGLCSHESCSFEASMILAFGELPEWHELS